MYQGEKEKKKDWCLRKKERIVSSRRVIRKVWCLIKKERKKREKEIKKGRQNAKGKRPRKENNGREEREKSIWQVNRKERNKIMNHLDKYTISSGRLWRNQTAILVVMAVPKICRTVRSLSSGHVLEAPYRFLYRLPGFWKCISRFGSSHRPKLACRFQHCAEHSHSSLSLKIHFTSLRFISFYSLNI